MSRRAFALASLLLVAGCSSQQAQPTPAPTMPDDPCQQVIDAMPENLDGEALTQRTGTSATWGSDMVLTCGVQMPAAYKKTSEVYVVNDISWFGEEQQDGYTFTAIGREPLVAIDVPSSHSPEVNPLADLAQVMEDTTTVTGPAGKN